MSLSSNRPGRIASYLAVLRYRDFRLLCASSVFDALGFMGENVVLGWTVLTITDSPLMVGLGLGLRSAPAFFLGLFAGAITDTVDRRKLMRLLDVGSAMIAVAIAVLLMSERAHLWQIFTLTVFSGVIGTIYESRPNVTIDIAVLCFKAGNAVILRGGKEAFNSNLALASLVRDCIESTGAPRDAVQFVESTDRALVGEMLAMKEHIDLMIPRGGEELVRRVAAEAAMPAITGGIGVCHTYVEGSAKIDMAVEIAYNAKVSRPSVCNALDTLLVDASVAPEFLPRIASEWSKAGVEMHCDRRALSILGRADGLKAVPATDDDWGKEFLSLTAAVKVVDSMDEALEHIEVYTSGHTEVIVTEDYTAAMRFLDEVDAGVVMVNASSRFNDGAQFGLGAEVGISTNKLHARGPMGLIELTSYKWTVLGSGQVRE